MTVMGVDVTAVPSKHNFLWFRQHSLYGEIDRS